MLEHLVAEDDVEAPVLDRKRPRPSPLSSARGLSTGSTPTYDTAYEREERLVGLRAAADVEDAVRAELARCASSRLAREASGRAAPRTA